MEESITTLIKKIDLICNKKYLLSTNNAGLLFENLLGIKPNDLSVPDIDGIEIKVSNKNKNYPIALFSCIFDGKDFFETKRFIEKFGARNRDYPSQKIMYMDINAKSFSFWGNFIKFKLIVDYKKEKIYVLVVHANGKIIEKRSFWDFNTLNCILNRKLSYLCLVDYSFYYSKKNCFCIYDNYTILKYTGFYNFLRLIENGDIFVNVNCGVCRSGKNIGKSCFHGLTFKIKKTVLLELFEVKKNSTYKST